MRLLFLFFSLLFTMTGISQSSMELPNFELWAAGFGMADETSALEVVSDKWGVRTIWLAGCMVSEELMDSIRIHNTEEQIKIKAFYGADWQERFNKDVEKERTKQNRLLLLLYSKKNINATDDSLANEGNGLHYYFKPLKTVNQYEISIEGWGKMNEKFVWMRYYLYRGDAVKKEVFLLSDKQEFIHL